MTTDELKLFFAKDRLAKYMSMEIVDCAPGSATIRMPIQEMHLNGFDAVHGGALFSLADFACAVASNSHGSLAVLVNASIHCMRPSKGDHLVAVAREIGLTAKFGTYAIEVLDAMGARVAAFQGMVYRTGKPLFPTEEK